MLSGILTRRIKVLIYWLPSSRGSYNASRNAIIWITGKSSPCNEEYLALLTVIRSNKIIVVYSISAIIQRQSCGEIVIILSRTTSLLNHNLLFTLINPKDHVTVDLLLLQFQKRVLGMITNTHAPRSVGLETKSNCITKLFHLNFPNFSKSNKVNHKKLLVPLLANKILITTRHR